MEEAGFFGIGHLDLSVSDVEASAAWYEKVLGLRRLRRVDFAERTMIVLRHDASGLVIGLNQHQGFPGEPFDERRAGLDHVGFAVGRRLAEAAGAAGTTVFATIDHAAGARSVGLDMPETQVLIVGNPAAGTLAMLAAPDFALELPTRLLVRQASPDDSGSTIVFYDPTALGRRYGLSSEQIAGLAGVVSLVDRALGAASDG